MATFGSSINQYLKPGVAKGASKAGDFLTNPLVNVLTRGHSGVLAGSVMDALNTGPAHDGQAYGSGGGGSASQVDQGKIDQFDQAIGSLNHSLGRLTGQLGAAQGNINSTYNTNLNELNSAKSQAKNSYNTGTTKNQQGYRTDKNVIGDQASTGLRSLQRLLGAYGAGGSSEGQYVAPEAVAAQATQQRAGAGQTYAENQSDLDTNWGNFQAEDKNQRSRLNDWRTQQMRSAESQSLTTRQDLLSKLADLKGKREAAAGGSYAGAAQPFIDQSNALSGRIDGLARFNPSYSGKTPVYKQTTLDNYVAEAAGPATMSPNGSGAGASPYLSMLVGDDRERQFA